jgi:hypothetical protein
MSTAREKADDVMVVIFLAFVAIFFLGLVPFAIYSAIHQFGETEQNKGLCQSIDGEYNLALDKCIVGDTLVEVPE